MRDNFFPFPLIGLLSLLDIAQSCDLEHVSIIFFE